MLSLSVSNLRPPPIIAQKRIAIQPEMFNTTRVTDCYFITQNLSGQGNERLVLNVLQRKVRRASLLHKQCFLCDKDVASVPNKGEGMTMTLNERLKECTSVSKRWKTTCKMSSGNIETQEIRYHLSCM